MTKWKFEDKRNDASLFPITYHEVSCGENSLMQKALGVHLKGMMHVFISGEWHYYTLPGDFHQMSQKLAEKAKADSNFVENAIKKSYQLGKELLELSEGIFNSNLSEKSNSELWGLLNEYGKRIKAMRAYAVIAPGLDYTSVLTELLMNILNKKLKLLGKENLVAKYFTETTTPLKKTLFKKEEIDLLSISAEIDGNSKLKELFVGEDKNNLIEGINSFPEFREKLNLHLRKYCWLPCTYEGDPWGIDHFVSEIKEILLRKNPSQELGRIKDDYKLIKNNYHKAINFLRLDSEELKWFNIAREIIFYKADRKDIFFQSYYEMRGLIEEIARRLDLSVKEVRFMLPKEIREGLLNDFVDREEVKGRTKICVAINKDDNTIVLPVRESHKYLEKNVIKSEIIHDLQELKGTCASSGNVKGKVKLVLSPNDMEKMDEGDILVSHATNPDIILAMKKAAAIVANTGGMTCHAAIVSRELKIPCVVGTKIATEILKDGDLIEVDADNGIVRRIE
jgi:phosphoenolpyruvate synthase/pyruvate phosphate dikinase